jgi:hypothetical protein
MVALVATIHVLARFYGARRRLRLLPGRLSRHGRARPDHPRLCTSCAWLGRRQNCVMVGPVPTIHVFARWQPAAIPAARSTSLAPQDVDGRHKGDHDGRGNLAPPFSRMGEGGAERRMRACPRRRRPQRLRCAQMISGGPSPLPLSHPGEGFPARFATRACLIRMT